MTDYYREVKKHSPLCEICKLRISSRAFRDAALDGGRPFHFELSVKETSATCDMCKILSEMAVPMTHVLDTQTVRVEMRKTSSSRIQFSINGLIEHEFFLYTWPGELPEDDIHTIDEDVTSPWSFQQANVWLEDCLQNHTRCGGPAPDSPRRVIELGLDSARLLVNSNDSEPYLALSYCWGGPQELELRKDRLVEYQQALPLKQLPKTILDAFEVTRRLGFKCIWIDSLCIVQDDEQDKLQDIINMTSIYSDCAAVISAATADNVKAGFLTARHPFNFMEMTTRMPFMRKDGSTGTIALAHGRAGCTYLSQDNPIEDRAWCFQERLLAPRVLIYSNKGLRFVCNDGIKSAISDETGLEIPLAKKGFEAGDPHVWRRNMVEDYTNRSMTNYGDKLVAISGLARAHASGRPAKDVYLAGLWADTLAWDLLWAPWRTQENVSQRVIPSTAPTWSWASTACAIYFTCRDDPVLPSMAGDFELLDHEIVPRAGHDRFGELSTSRLRLRGRSITLSSTQLASFGWGPSPDDPEIYIRLPHEKDEPYYIPNLQDRWTGEILFIDQKDFSTYKLEFDHPHVGRSEVTLLHTVTGEVIDMKRRKRIRQRGLLLERVIAAGVNKYHKVGTFKIDLSTHLRTQAAPGEKSIYDSPRFQYDCSMLKTLAAADVREFVVI